MRYSARIVITVSVRADLFVSLFMRFEPVANRIGHRSVANRRKLELLNKLCPEGNQSIRLTIEIQVEKSAWTRLRCVGRSAIF